MRELNFVFVHQLRAAFVDQASQVGDPDVFAANAQLDQQAQTRQGSSTRARGDQLHLARIFTHHFQAIQDGRANGDGCAMLVVVKDGDFHALAQLALHIKTVGGLDVFEVDAAKGRL